MNLRNIDGTQIVNLKEGSHKKILFDCDVCGDTVEQSYRNYIKQNDGKFCRKCRNKHTANRPDVKEKQAQHTKEMWNNKEFRENITKKVSVARKKEWSDGTRKAKKPVLGKNEKILQEIKDHLIDNGIEFTFNDNKFFLNQDKPNKVELEYIPSEKFYKEIPQFNMPGIKLDYFYNKSKESERNGSFTYYIKDFEWLDENKREIMKSQMLHLTNKTPYRYYARDTEVKVFSNRDLKEFEIKNCFYGYRGSSLNLGLVLKKEKYGMPVGTILMIMNFGKNFFAKKENYVEVFRVGTLKKSQVIGGASKLFKYFVDNYPTITISNKEVFYNKIVYYVDYDHGSGKSVSSMGFEWVRDTKGGFMNVDLSTNLATHRKPMHHKEVMEQIKEGKVCSVPNAGVLVYEYTIDENTRKETIQQKNNEKSLNLFFNKT